MRTSPATFQRFVLTYILRTFSPSNSLFAFLPLASCLSLGLFVAPIPPVSFPTCTDTDACTYAYYQEEFCSLASTLCARAFLRVAAHKLITIIGGLMPRTHARTHARTHTQARARTRECPRMLGASDCPPTLHAPNLQEPVVFAGATNGNASKHIEWLQERSLARVFARIYSMYIHSM